MNQLKPGPHWESFDAFRSRHVANFASIKPGEVATIRVKAQQWRVMHDEDFQALSRTALWIARLDDAQSLLTEAAAVYGEHPTPASQRLLLICVARLTAIWKEKA